MGRSAGLWLGALACAAAAQAPHPSPLPPGGVPTHADVEACLRSAARHHGVDAALLRAIAQVESGLNVRAINRSNRNGSRDLGLMQINSAWLPVLARHGVREAQLYEPCVSAHVGAWILAANIARHGPVWRAVGAYNAISPARQLVYVRKVRAQLARAGASPVSAARPSRRSGLADR
ncbi:lytic transglycosylase domain-containing protein [Verticiella sediminum]|uniref:Lytic transglycosylase domain-containing protein n=2 Tax=Verticiella sediminum TaxID=1247510 RepID=A0A556AW39_9BURK|nr:lytic transglycosylase domain-containing protein [Verticiella sediminum]